MAEPLHQYLDRYSEPEAAALSGLPGSYRHALVVPVYQEPVSALLRLLQLTESEPGTLLVLVLNQPLTGVAADSESWYKPWFETLAPGSWCNQHQTISLHPLKTSAVLLIDRCNRGAPVPDQQGVGLARKIGADCACRLIAQGSVTSPWIFTTDADALLPAGYFSAADTIDSAAALVYPFAHTKGSADRQTLAATRLYEWSLNYYVAGLRWADSPYAYHTIGSTLAIHYQHYAKVRGFPKRAGGEDFYLLNKLNKTGAIISLGAPCLQILARRSNRVPFGTGPAVNRLLARATDLDIELYHPDCFTGLKALLTALRRFATDPNKHPKLSIDREIPISQLPVLIDLDQALEHSRRQAKDSAGRWQQLWHWFDGFKTLQLIHQLRDRHFGVVSFNALKQREFHDVPFSTSFKEVQNQDH